MFQVNININENDTDLDCTESVNKDIQEFIKGLNDKYNNLNVSLDDTKNNGMDIHHTENGHYVCVKTRNIGGKLLFTTIGDSMRDSVIIGGIEINKDGELKVYNSTVVNNKREMTHRIYPEVPHKIN